MEKKLSPETICVHGTYNPKLHNSSRAVPLYQSAAFVYDSVDHAANLFAQDEAGFIYSRIGNPTVDEVEKRITLSPVVSKVHIVQFTMLRMPNLLQREGKLLQRSTKNLQR